MLIEQSIKAIYVNKDNEIIIVFNDKTVYKVDNNTLIKISVLSYDGMVILVSDFKGVLRTKYLISTSWFKYTYGLYMDEDTYQLVSLPITTDRVYSTAAGQTLPIIAYPIVEEADKITYYYAGAALTSNWEYVTKTIKKHKVDISNICLLASNNGDKFNLGTNNNQIINLVPEALYIQGQKIPLYRWDASSNYWKNIEDNTDDYVIVETNGSEIKVTQ